MNTFESPAALIDVAGLGKRYGTRTVVQDVTMRVDRGGLIALVGANGGGKTTTLRMLAGLLRPDVGSGRVLGNDVRHPRRAQRASTGYMAQRIALYPELSVMENLQFRAGAQQVPNAPKRIAETLQTYGLQRIAHTRVDQLSGGWARRAQFAATLLHRPALLLLDEPTAGLDVVTRRDIWAWLDILAAAGHGIVISTHDLVEAQRCSTLLFYNDGAVRELATANPS
jgi:ABC-2 type transport system ATP-binding protein